MHGSASGVARASAPVALTRPGTTAQCAESLEEWWSDLEHVWRIRRAPEVQRLHGRAKRSDLAPRQRNWARDRATSQAMTRTNRLRLCRKRWISFGCACQRIERPVGCDVTMLCDWCRRRHLRRWRRRITRGLDGAQRAAHAAWKSAGRPRKREPAVYLITLSTSHSGDVARDRDDIWRGWRTWLRWLERTVGARVPYAAVWEVTAGRDGKGHVHCHVAAVLPWFDWSAAQAVWQRACPSSSHADYQRCRAAGAAKYLAKYATKGASLDAMSGALAGELLAAWYGRRRISCSRGFWRPLQARGACECRRCGAAWNVVEVPHGIARDAPQEVLQALARRYGVVRGPPSQRRMLWPDVNAGGHLHAVEAKVRGKVAHPPWIDHM